MIYPKAFLSPFKNNIVYHNLPYMKKLILFATVCLLCCIAFPFQSMASHAAGAEMTYIWKSDSTYTIIYHFYRDCTGVTTPDSVTLCYYDSCDGYQNTVYMRKAATISGGRPNGSDVMLACPYYPNNCHGGTYPGYQEWWYTRDVTLPSRCGKWTFAHTESARNGALKNITADNLYVEATLNNEVAQGNSSAFFAVKPVVFLCINTPYTYTSGEMDVNGDSLYFESITPMTSGADCGPASNETYFSGYSLPSNPLATGGTFSTNSSTGQMSFTPNLYGTYSLAMRVSEYRYISGSWIKIGTVMRDMIVIIGGCTVIPPSLAITGGASSFSACAATPLSFCFNIKGADTLSRLVVTDNAALLGGSVTYTNALTDSVNGCFSWIPGPLDTGSRTLLVTVKDSICGPGTTIPVPSTFIIPVYVSPSTKILNDTNALCVGDSVMLAAIGGNGFVWDVLPGGSSSASLSCTTCRLTTARPTVTTTYTVHATGPMSCKNRDTVTIVVRATPFVPVVSLVAAPNTGVSLGTTVTYTATVTKGGLLPVFEWFKNGTLIPGATSSVYVTNTVTPADVIKVLVHSDAPCVNPDTASASAVVLAVDDLPGNTQPIKLYPSPNNGSFSMVGNISGLTSNKAAIGIVNITGQLVYSAVVPVSNGKINTQIALPKDIPAGIYTLRFTSGDQTYHLNFAIQR